jgi:hypothetical protein
MNVQTERLPRHHHRYLATKITVATDIQDPTGTVAEVTVEIQEMGDLEAETQEVEDMVEEAVDGSLAAEDPDHREDPGDLEAETQEVEDTVEEVVDGSLAVEDTDHREDLEDMVAGGTPVVVDGILEEEDQAHQVDHHLHLERDPTTLTPGSPRSYANLT